MRHVVTLALLLSACNEPSIAPIPRVDGDGFAPVLGTPTKTDRVVQVTRPEVDILWVLDNSCSMSEEQAALALNFPRFLDFFVDSGLDWHIGLVSTDTDNPEENGKLMGYGAHRFIDDRTPMPAQLFEKMTSLGTGGSASERGLLAAYRAINQPTQSHKQRNQDFLRDDAALHIIVISDEEDQSAPFVRRNEFITFLQELKADEDTPVTLSAIVGPAPSGCRSSMGDAMPGSIYIGVANATGGLHQSICEEDWSPLLEELGLHAAGLRREYFLSELPVTGTIEMWVVDGDFQYDGIERSALKPRQTVKDACDEAGLYACFPFDYNPQRNSVIIDQQFVPGAQAEIFIRYSLLGQQQPETKQVD